MRGGRRSPGSRRRRMRSRSGSRSRSRSRNRMLPSMFPRTSSRSLPRTLLRLLRLPRSRRLMSLPSSSTLMSRTRTKSRKAGKRRAECSPCWPGLHTDNDIHAVTTVRLIKLDPPNALHLCHPIVLDHLLDYLLGFLSFLLPLSGLLPQRPPLLLTLKQRLLIPNL